MNTVTTTSFRVSDVPPPTTPLPEVPYKDAIEALLTVTIPERDRQSIQSTLSRRLSIAPPEPPASRPLEACARYHGRLLGNVSHHPVVAAVHHAFMDHRPLRLSPDTIWLMICQAVANHVNVHAEELRHRFVRHEGKAEIEVRRDDFVKGSPENPWAEVIDALSEQVRQHVGPAIDLFLPAFSTTGQVERVAAELVLLDAMRSYFQYLLRTRCGIPTITLEGTTADWEALARRTEGFAEFGLETWTTTLSPILRQFVRATDGDVDANFWRSMYKHNDQSGGPVITGWITAFFPYLVDRKTGLPSVPITDLLEDGERDMDEMLYPGEERQRGFAHGPTMERLPGGLSKAPFLWDYLNRPFDMEFLAGFVGVAQDQETLTLRPEIGWAVREAPAAG